MWKIARIIPLPKPSKDLEQSKRFHHVAFLSPMAKLIEKILLPKLHHNIQLADHQPGFRSARSNVTALNCLNHHITERFNHGKPFQRTLMTALDLTAAFDTVNHKVLLADIYNSKLTNQTKRWLFPLPIRLFHIC